MTALDLLDAIAENSRFRWTPTSLEVLDPSIPFEDVEKIFYAASGLGDTARWILGDTLLFAESRYGERYAQLLDAGRVSARQLSRYRYVAERVRNVRRRENLSFSHHEEVAVLEPAEQERSLAKAETEGWSRTMLRDFVQNGRAVAAKPSQPAKTPEFEILPALSTVDVARGLDDVRETLEKLEGVVSPEGAEALGIPNAKSAIEAASSTVVEALRVLSRPALADIARRVVKEATRSSGFAMVPVEVWEEFVAVVAAE